MELGTALVDEVGQHHYQILVGVPSLKMTKPNIHLPSKLATWFILTFCLHLVTCKGRVNRNKGLLAMIGLVIAILIETEGDITDAEVTITSAKPKSYLEKLSDDS